MLTPLHVMLPREEERGRMEEKGEREKGERMEEGEKGVKWKCCPYFILYCHGR